MTSAVPPVSALGRRIVVIGPSGSGKSTLAQAMAAKLEVPAIHLDLLYHQPYSDWVPRPTSEFEGLHAGAISAPEWICDGNYTSLIEPRLARATGLIWLDPPLYSNFWGYLKRCLSGKQSPDRLPGGGERIKWLMVHHILVVQPASHAKMQNIFDSFDRARHRVGKTADLRHLFERWDLVPGS